MRQKSKNSTKLPQNNNKKQASIDSTYNLVINDNQFTDNNQPRQRNLLLNNTVNNTKLYLNMRKFKSQQNLYKLMFILVIMTIFMIRKSKYYEISTYSYHIVNMITSTHQSIFQFNQLSTINLCLNNNINTNQRRESRNINSLIGNREYQSLDNRRRSLIYIQNNHNNESYGETQIYEGFNNNGQGRVENQAVSLNRLKTINVKQSRNQNDIYTNAYQDLNETFKQSRQSTSTINYDDSRALIQKNHSMNLKMKLDREIMQQMNKTHSQQSYSKKRRLISLIDDKQLQQNGSILSSTLLISRNNNYVTDTQNDSKQLLNISLNQKREVKPLNFNSKKHSVDQTMKNSNYEAGNPYDINASQSKINMSFNLRSIKNKSVFQNGMNQSLIQSQSDFKTSSPSKQGSLIFKIEQDFKHNFLTIYRENQEFQENHTINEDKTLLLFEARMKDLDLMTNISSVKKAYLHFKQFILSYSKQGVLNMRNMQLGLNSAFCLQKILSKSRHQHIKVLNLCNNNLGDDGIKLLSQNLKDSLSLITLNLSSNNISLEGAKFLFEAIRKNQSIIDLNLSNEIDSKTPNRIGPQGAILLAEIMKEQKFITIINLKGNGIGNKGFMALCKVLKTNKTVISINAEKNQISSVGLEKLSKIIRKNHDKISLKELIVSKNELGNTAVENFMYECCYSSQILKLDISDCSINSEISQNLFLSLKNSRYLQQLNLGSNLLNQTYEYLIRDCLITNSTLRILNLSHCQMGDQTAIGLFKGLQRNNTLTNLILRANNLTDIIKDYLYDLLTCKVSLLKFLDLSQNQLTDFTGMRIAKALETNVIMLSLNLEGNSLKVNSGEAFSKATIINQVIQKLKLRFNMIKFNFIKSIKANLKRNRMKNITQDVPYNIEEIKRMKQEQNKKGEISFQIEKALTEKQREREEIEELEKEFEEMKVDEENRTRRLEEEYNRLLKKRKFLDSDFAGIEEKDKKITQKKESEISILSNSIIGTIGMIPIQQRDIIESNEKAKRFINNYFYLFLD